MPRQTTSPADYPQAVLQQIEQLAQNIVIARKRRGESQAQWAKKLGISQPTMARIERGDPSVAMASYVMCMWLINQASGLADLIAPQHDHAALEKEVAKVKTTRNLGAKKTKSLRDRKVSQAQPPSSQNVESAQKQLDNTIEAVLGISPKEMATYSELLNTSLGLHSPASPGLAALLAKSDPKKK
jgi:DNA-binding XRE family transcriptional regulator